MIFKTSRDFVEDLLSIRVNFSIDDSYFLTDYFNNAEIKFYTVNMEDMFAVTLLDYNFDK